MKVKILLWNTEGNKQALEVLLEEAKYDLLAIQEPWINKHTKGTHCPRSSKYYLIHSREGRAAIFVSKRYRVGEWEYKTTKDWCRVWFPALGEGGLELWSVYNPRKEPGTPRLQGTVQDLLRGPPPTNRAVVAGDFNLHHPLWDQFERYERRSEDLLELAQQWDLELRTPMGAITRAPQGDQVGRTSTIDHFWASIGLEATYHGLEIRGKTDHYPQVLEVETGRSAQQQSQPEGWNWKMMHKKGVLAEAAQLPLKFGLADLGPQGLQARTRTREGLDQAFISLAQELKRIAEDTTPRKKTSRGQQSPWWSEEVQEAVREARQAEREHRETPTAHCKARLNEGLRALTTAIRTERTKVWRAKLQEATTDQKTLWSLERWARLQSFRAPDPPKLPALLGPHGGPELTTHQEKA